MSGSYIATSSRPREAELLGTALRAGQEQPPPLLARLPKAPALKECCPAAGCLCSQATGSEEQSLVPPFGSCATHEQQHPETSFIPFLRGFLQLLHAQTPRSTPVTASDRAQQVLGEGCLRCPH